MTIAFRHHSALAIALTIYLVAAIAATAKPVSADDIAQFKVGETTSAEVIAKLGLPVSTGTSSDGIRVLTYGSTHARAKAISFVPIVGLFAGGATSETTTVVLTFDASDKLKNAVTTTTKVDCSNHLVGLDCKR